MSGNGHPHHFYHPSAVVLDEREPQDPGRLLYMQSQELTHLVNQPVEWTPLPVPVVRVPVGRISLEIAML